MENWVYGLKGGKYQTTTDIEGNPAICYVEGTDCYRLRKLLHNMHRSIGP